MLSLQKNFGKRQHSYHGSSIRHGWNRPLSNHPRVERKVIMQIHAWHLTWTFFCLIVTCTLQYYNIGYLTFLTQGVTSYVPWIWEYSISYSRCYVCHTLWYLRTHGPLKELKWPTYLILLPIKGTSIPWVVSGLCMRVRNSGVPMFRRQGSVMSPGRPS